MDSVTIATSSTQRWRNTWVALLVAVLFVAAPGIPKAASQSFSEGLLWRVSRPGIADSFVLGTTHLADPRIIISKSVDYALARSRTLATELTRATLTEEQWAGLEEFDDARRLDELLEPDTFAELCSRLAAQDISANVVARLKAWVAMLKLSRVESGTVLRSLDVQILASARARRMRVKSLESVEEQAASFDAIPLDSQVALLKHVLVDHEALASAVDATVDAWLRRDLEALAQAATHAGQRFPGMGDHYEQLVRHVVRNRTSVMHHRLFMPLRAGRVFVAVGATHLYGNDGLLRMLEDDGYRVRRIW